MSNTSVKEAILDLVKHEDGGAPLSDQEIVEILTERGIPIARRTVAKYRTELNILPSHMRRKYGAISVAAVCDRRSKSLELRI